MPEFAANRSVNGDNACARGLLRPSLVGGIPSDEPKRVIGSYERSILALARH
ncbi:hypothetical protein MJ923_10540 [Shewanella sp. 3B26]|uniref:Uncharacterized protein n=1 Tax=Shewanella zhuhaiensis TaxID=2919576 RepID=A0AAJ1F0T4_9GAMM|nr:hypothetical protein [Shewanella zhuhaiensis]MCH4294738.1 hypothetical protein [Shewanella zhuhaiensis]